MKKNIPEYNRITNSPDHIAEKVHRHLVHFQRIANRVLNLEPRLSKRGFAWRREDGSEQSPGRRRMG